MAFEPTEEQHKEFTTIGAVLDFVGLTEEDLPDLRKEWLRSFGAPLTGQTKFISRMSLDAYNDTAYGIKIEINGE